MECIEICSVFCQEVSGHVFSWDMIHNDITPLDVVANVVESDVHVYGSLVVYRALSELDREE
jgi:hypothetical protein